MSSLIGWLTTLHFYCASAVLRRPRHETHHTATLTATANPRNLDVRERDHDARRAVADACYGRRPGGASHTFEGDPEEPIRNPHTQRAVPDDDLRPRRRLIEVARPSFEANTAPTRVRTRGDAAASLRTPTSGNLKLRFVPGELFGAPAAPYVFAILLRRLGDDPRP